MKRFLLFFCFCSCLAVALALPVFAARPAAAYLQALELYARGQYQEASVVLLRSRPTSSVRQDKSVYGLWRDISRKLATEDPEALVPISGLFSRAHARLLDLEVASAAALFTDVIEGLLEDYVEQSTALDSREIASRVLTHVAIDIRDRQQSFHAMGTLELALEYDPDNIAALQVLAALAEKDGDYAEAAIRLEQLLLADPENAMARLRLGVVGLRLGNVDQAFADLQRVIDEAPEPWLAIVAYQEIARGRLELQETEQAILTVEEALERFPGQERLMLQLAFLRGERFSSPESLLAGLTSKPWDRELTPRLLYNNWPDEEVLVARQQVAADIEARLASLRRTFDGR